MEINAIENKEECDANKIETSTQYENQSIDLNKSEEKEANLNNPINKTTDVPITVIDKESENPIENCTNNVEKFSSKQSKIINERSLNSNSIDSNSEQVDMNGQKSLHDSEFYSTNGKAIEMNEKVEDVINNKGENVIF